MTAAERLVALAGQTGTAAALLLLIGTGATTGAALVDYSKLDTGTAAQHLLADPVAQPPEPPQKRAGGSGAVVVPAVEVRVVRGHAQAAEVERAHAAARVVLSASAEMGEFERARAGAVVVVTASTVAVTEKSGTARAVGHARLDWERINALDEEVLLLS